MAKTAPSVTDLIRRAADGSKDAEAALVAAVYRELHRIARRLMRGEAANHTLQTTALVHEAYLRLAGTEAVVFKDRVHFFAIAATVMRRILVDYARAKRAQKRGGREGPPVDLLGPSINIEEPERVLAIDDALNRLSQLDERQARVVELRFFAGMTIDETAEALQISTRTVKREWQLAKAWLYGELQP